MSRGEAGGASGEEIRLAAQIACLLEAAAPKPGNVSPSARFADARFEDYLLSAAAIGPAMAAAGDRGVGATILRAVRETGEVTGANTNLGIILLLAPLAQAAARRVRGRGETCGRATRRELRESLARVLAELSVADAQDAYVAIRDASPGGLGAVPDQDVREPPTITLREAMALAADRDSIAREYVTDYAITFERTVPALERARSWGLGWSDAVVQAHLELLAQVPDTLIARKLGRQTAEEVSRAAREVLDVGGVRTDAGRRAIAAFDRDLRGGQNARNPGTTADLVAAGLFVLWWAEGECV